MDVHGDSNLDLIVAIIALSTAVFVGHLEYLAAETVREKANANKLV